METTIRKIGNSVGAIFSKDISPEVGKIYTIIKIGETYVLKAQKRRYF